MKIRVTFLGPRQARAIFMSNVFLDKTYTYLLVRTGERYNHYVTLNTGTMEVVRLGKDSEIVQRLRPYPKYSLKHAAEIYLRSTLIKTDEAVEVLDAILNNEDDEQINFLLEKKNHRDSKRGGLEKPTKQERNIIRANMVSLDQICNELKIAPARARALLRKHDVKKPGASWSWEKSQYSQVLNMFRKML